jgi:hypothetical protein
MTLSVALSPVSCLQCSKPVAAAIIDEQAAMDVFAGVDCPAIVHE